MVPRGFRSAQMGTNEEKIMHLEHIGIVVDDIAAEHARLSREITDLRKVLQRRHSGSRSKQGFIAWCQAAASRGGPSATDAERFLSLAPRRLTDVRTDAERHLVALKQE